MMSRNPCIIGDDAHPVRLNVMAEIERNNADLVRSFFMSDSLWEGFLAFDERLTLKKAEKEWNRRDTERGEL